MTPAPQPSHSFLDLPVGAKRQVDRVCLEFEQVGRDARVEAFLDRVDPDLRATLLAELLAIELEWRRAAGEVPAAAEYLARYPDAAPAVRTAFRQTTAPEVGGTLGKYQLTGVLGRGGMGVVFEAVDPVIGRPVAIKVLPDRLLADPRAHDRLLQEARLAGQLLHPNVVALFEVGEADGTVFLVLERVTGGSAADRLRRDGPLDPPFATRIAADVCRGLAAIHAAGFLHLDVKPANILLPTCGPTGGGVLAKLTDFSLSITDPAGAGPGATAGTPAYMSPEQRTNGAVSQRTDVFGVGAAYFALLTGRAPFAGATVTEVVAEQVRNPAPDPRTVSPTVPDQVARIVRRAMAPRPEDRYPTATAMLADLETALAPPRPARWRGVVAAVVGAAVMLAIAVILSIALSAAGVSFDTRPAPPVPPLARIDAWEPLLDGQDLAGWRPVVPEGRTAIGEGPASEFGIVELGGLPVLRASGTGLGAVESEREFENFYLRFEYRWATADGDYLASIRYHCSGAFGARGLHGMELHLQRAGSYLRLNDLLRFDIGEIRGTDVAAVRPGGRRIDPLQGKEAPVGRWNRAALVCVRDWAIHAINGTPVLVLAGSKRTAPPDDPPLTRGRLRFQSVKGEIFFRKIEVREVSEIPPEFRLPLDAPGAAN